MSTILVIGKVPPPVGGVTVFVLRQIALLRTQGNVVQLFPSNRFNDFYILCNLIMHRYDKVIINTMSFSLLFFIYLTSNNKNSYIVDHNHSRHFNSSIKSKVKQWLLKKVKAIHLVDGHLKGNYDAAFKNLVEINPFMPPTPTEIKNSEKALPSHISKFISGKDKLIIISAWRYIEEDNIELYGLNDAINAFMQIQFNTINVGLVICLGDSDFNEDKVLSLFSRVRNINNIVIWEGCTASWALFSSKSIYIRPTSTDGNSISIHEALFFGAKVIASDVVIRPQGCITYEYGNLESLKLKIITLLEKMNETNSSKHI